jgi:hypothetical protein
LADPQGEAHAEPPAPWPPVGLFGIGGYPGGGKRLALAYGLSSAGAAFTEN